MKLDNSYDVVIVGAGPGGSITARDCARAGLKVLLLEKRPEIGAPKRCAEGIIMKDLKRIGYAENEPFVAQKMFNCVLVLPNGKRLELPRGSGGCILERKVFDKWLAYDAAKAGAKVVANAEVVDLLKSGSKISGVSANYNSERLNIAAKVVVAADGVESKIAKIAGLNTCSPTKKMGSGYQYEMAGIDIENPHKYYVYIGSDISPAGYIWVFPKGDHIANVGIGIAAGNYGKTAKYYLDKWIDSTPSIRKGSIIEENAGGIPLGNFLKKMTLDNFLVVGDAAHQVNPIHGGGLAEATYAGQLAAKVITRAIKEGDTSDKNLDEYNRTWWKERGTSLLKIEKFAEVFEQMSDQDINKTGEMLDGSSIRRLSDGDVIFLAKILMKNPRLAMVAIKLI